MRKRIVGEHYDTGWPSKFVDDNNDPIVFDVNLQSGRQARAIVCRSRDNKLYWVNTKTEMPISDDVRSYRISANQAL